MSSLVSMYISQYSPSKWKYFKKRKAVKMAASVNIIRERLEVISPRRRMFLKDNVKGLQTYVNVYDPKVSQEGKTLLHLAVKYGSLKCLEYLLNFEDAPVNEKDPAGETPLMVAAKHRKHGSTMVRMLLAHGGCSQININTALLYATKHFHQATMGGLYPQENLPIISLLLRAGADAWFHILNNIHVYSFPERSLNKVFKDLPYEHEILMDVTLDGIKLFLRNGAVTDTKMETLRSICSFGEEERCLTTALETCLVNNTEGILKTCVKFSITAPNDHVKRVTLRFELLCKTVELILANGINLEEENTAVELPHNTGFKSVLDQFLSTLEKNSKGMRNLYYWSKEIWQDVLTFQCRIVRACLFHGIELKQKMVLVCLLTVNRTIGEQILATILDTLTQEDHRSFIMALTQDDYRKDSRWCNLKEICEGYLQHFKSLPELCRIVILRSASPHPEGLLTLNLPTKIKSYLFYGCIPESLS